MDSKYKWAARLILAPLGVVIMVFIVMFMSFHIFDRSKSLIDASVCSYLNNDSKTQGKYGILRERSVIDFKKIIYNCIINENKHVRLLVGKLYIQKNKGIIKLLFPVGIRFRDMWTFFGPLKIKISDYQCTVNRFIVGYMCNAGPAIGLYNGIWRGLSSIIWNDSYNKMHKVKWLLSSGWYMDDNNNIILDNGTVHWLNVSDKKKIILNADKVIFSNNFASGNIKYVLARNLDSYLKANGVSISREYIKFFGSIFFFRDDGLSGYADSGCVSRRANSIICSNVRFSSFIFSGLLNNRLITAAADYAHWMSIGIVLKGKAYVVMQHNTINTLLQADTILHYSRMNRNIGYSKEYVSSELWAGINTQLLYNDKMLSGYVINYISNSRHWSLSSPMYGTYGNSFSFIGGDGYGVLDNWKINGPIILHQGKETFITSDSLITYRDRVLLSGHPIIIRRINQIINGYCIVCHENIIYFTNGISAFIPMLDNNIALKANSGIIGQNFISLDGDVECNSLDWHVLADHVLLVLNENNVIVDIIAKGSVSFYGDINNSIGECYGNEIFINCIRKTFTWFGPVHVQIEE